MRYKKKKRKGEFFVIDSWTGKSPLGYGQKYDKEGCQMICKKLSGWTKGGKVARSDFTARQEKVTS